MTDEQIEAVAKELAFDRCSNAWENMEELWREVCRTEARRIIKAYEAVRLPIPGMVSTDAPVMLKAHAEGD